MRIKICRQEANLFFSILLCTAIFACSGAEENKAADVKLPGEETLLARVNGEAITQYDLDQSIRGTLGAQGGKMLDADGRQSMLESLVAARAIAQAQEKTLSPEQTRIVAKKADAFRDQLLVKMYLAHNTPPAPVTDQMIKAYYDSHLEQFGARTVRSYEMISTQDGIPDAVRDQLLTELATPDKIDDWSATVERLKKKGMPVAYRSATSETRILNTALQDLIKPLNTGQCSQPTLINGALYIVRITDAKQIAAKPLAQVSAGIRKTLRPVQLKKAVKQASDQVLKTADVDYLTPAGEGKEN